MTTIYVKSNRQFCIQARVAVTDTGVLVELFFFNPTEGSNIERVVYTFDDYPDLQDIVEKRAMGNVWNPIMLDELVNVWDVALWNDTQIQAVAV